VCLSWGGIGTLDVNNLADLTSTFRFTATAELNRTVVECSGVTVATVPSSADHTLR